MADFSTFNARREAFTEATGVVDRIRAAYGVAVGVRDLLALYQAGTNPQLVAAIDAAYTGAQKAEIAAIANKLAAFATDMETNHASLLAGS